MLHISSYLLSNSLFKMSTSRSTSKYNQTIYDDDYEDNYRSYNDNESVIVKILLRLQKSLSGDILEHFNIKFSDINAAVQADINNFNHEKKRVEDLIYYKYPGWKIIEFYVDSSDKVSPFCRVDLDLSNDYDSDYE